MKTLLVLASAMVILFLVGPNKIEAQKRKTARIIEGTILGYECGDNCYLTILDKTGKQHRGLCTAHPLCTKWNREVMMPESYKGKRVKVTVGKGTQLTGSGDVVGTMAAFTRIQLLTAPLSAALPEFRKGTLYRTVREQLMKLGWQPVTLPSARPCGDDDRCRGFPEVYSCSGIGRAECMYMWRKNNTLIRVWAWREGDQIYDGLTRCQSLNPTQIDGFGCR